MMYERLNRLYSGIHHLGVGPAIHYRLRRFQNQRIPGKAPFALHSRRLQWPVYCRPQTTDIDVFSQIFVHREYRCLDGVTDVNLVIDCGANVGYSSAYFLSAFPKAKVIAVEPDPANFHALLHNLAPYGDRVRAIQSAVWSHSTALKLSTEIFRDGREWSRTVVPTSADDPEAMSAVDIGTLLEESGHDRISILKIDIEGAERQVFAENFESWINRVDNLVIELHGDDCESTFRTAVGDRGFELSECDELSVCQRPK